jgi:hypothetical protein
VNSGDRLRWRRPISQLFSAAPWAALAYLASYLVLGALWFVVGLAALLAGAIFSIFWIGIPILAAALAVTRGLATAERARTKIASVRIRAPYRPVGATGVLRPLRIRMKDPATWRDALVLVLLWPVLFVLDLVAVTVWLIFAGMISLPLWYSNIPNGFDNGTSATGVVLGYFPHGPYGGGHFGWFIDNLGSALVCSGVGIALVVLIGNYLLVGAARLHLRISGPLLSRAIDPLAPAKQVLAGSPYAGIASLDPWSSQADADQDRGDQMFGDLPAERLAHQP